MAKVGYIFKENNDSFDAEREWMQRYGCVQIVEETVEHETLRPMWKQLMANLQRGDEIVISKFSNAARGLRELAAFIELCRIKIVRVISIHDRVDTRGELFPGTTAADVLWIIGHFRKKLPHYENIPLMSRSYARISKPRLCRRYYLKLNEIRQSWICISTGILSMTFGLQAVLAAKVLFGAYSINMA